MEKAREAKSEFESRGHTAFVARYDIAVSVEWRNEVRKNLDDCDALVAIVTDSFQHSAYANQEVGIILGKRKPIASLKFKGLPGLLDDYQAVDMSQSSLKEAIEQIVAAVKELKGNEPQPQPHTSSIVEKADQFLSEKLSSFKNDWPGTLEKPFRRVLIQPQRTIPGMLKAPFETDDWLYNNHPRILDYSQRQTTQDGLSFVMNSPRYAEVSYSTGEIYYGELIRETNGVYLGKVVIIVGQVINYARKTYKQFGYVGDIKIGLKVGNVKGLALRDDSIAGLLGENYATNSNEILVSHRTTVTDLDDPVPHVARIIAEFCRAFDFRFQDLDAKEYAKSLVTQ